jgi:glucose 1-dehydrogenase
MTARLRGRATLVTGSSSGIGRAIATLFAEEGADLMLCDLQPGSRLEEEQPSTERVVRDLGRTALFQRTDVGIEADVERAMVAAERAFGRLDVLVNCAGVFVRRSAADLELAEWRRVFDVNLTAHMLTVRAALPLLRKSPGASVVNVSSIHGRVGTGAAASYCASKGGVENLTRQLAVDLAADGIRCNAIAPGTIETAMSKPFREDPALLAEYRRRTLLPRLGEPRDVAYAALYLASDEASFVTGHSLVVDGGWTCA